MTRSHKWIGLRYGCAFVTVALAIVIRRLLDPWLGALFPFQIIFFAIMLTALVGGLGPALTAVCLGGLGADYFLLAPRGSFNLERTELLGLLLYLATGIGIALLGGLMQRARRQAEAHAAALRANNAQLEGRVQQRTAELEQKTQVLEAEVAARRQDAAHLHLLETCLNRVNDIVLITEAEPHDEPGPRTIYVNDAFVRRTGFTRAEAIGKTPRMLQGPKTDRLQLARIREALRAWQPVRVELINYTKTGEEFWLDLDIVPVADAQGWFTHWVAVERDITDRKLADEKAARLAAIVQFSDDAIIGKDLYGIVTSWNAGAEKIFGFTTDEMVGQPILRLIPLERQHEEDEILAQVRRGESIRHCDTVRQRKDGGTLEVSITVSPIKDVNGRIIGVSKIARDITERKQAEKALQASEARFRTLVETAPEAIFIQTNGCFVYVNAAAVQLFGATQPAELLGQSVISRVYPEYQAGVLERIRMLNEQRQPAGSGDVVFMTLNGAPRNVITSGVPFHYQNQNGALVFARDITERKQAEERHRLLAETMLQGVVHQASDGSIIVMNPAAERILGRTREQFLGSNSVQEEHHTIREDGSPFPGQEHPAMVALHTGQNVRGVVMGVWNPQAKARRWINIDAVPLFSPGATRPAEVYAIFEDITERKQAEAALALERQKLSAAFENTDMGFVLFDTRGAGLIMNQAALRFHGFGSVEDMLTKIEEYAADWELHYPDGRLMPFSEWPVSRAIAGDYVQNYEVQLHNLRTNYAWVGSYTAKPVRNSSGELSLILLTILDITERKRAEADKQESEERFRTMANSMSQLAWIAKADGYIFWYNQRWYEYTGTTPEQMEGWGWQKVHDPAVLPKVMTEWQVAIDSGKPFDMEFPLRGADGQFRNFLTRGQPLKDSAGRVVQWFGTNTDVDELKQAERKIRQLNAGLEERVAKRTAQLEAANKELEAFSYSVSHDLRAPLRAVNGFAGMVLAEFSGQLPPAGKHYLERIQKGGLRMGTLIDDLLAFSRLSRQSVNWQTVEVGKLVNAAWEELTPQRDGREIELRVGDLPSCQGDLALLKQVWINLLSNAVKYTQGRVPAVIKIGCTHENGEAVYFVRDNGAGFDMQFVNKLFGVFQRLHRADEFEGTGVGLAIVQRIIHRHGGRIWAEAALKRGATFYFTLAARQTT